MNFLTGIGGSFVRSLFGWLTGDLAGMLSLIGDVIAHAGATTTISHAASLHYPRMMGIAPLIAIICVPLAVLTELRGGPMWRPLVYLGGGVLGAFFAPHIATLILQSTDALGHLVTPHLGRQIDAVGSRINTGALSPAGAVVGIICLVAGVIVCFELVVRSVIVVLLICTVPLIAGALCWSPARRVMARVIEIFIAVAFAKLIIELTLALGLTLLSLQKGVSISLLAGATLCLAAFTPFVILRVMPIGDPGVMHHLDGLRQRLVHNVARSPQHPVAQAALNMVPVSPPSPPTTPEDLGLDMWPGEPERPLPPRDGPPPRPPVRPVRFPRRPVIRESESGPRIEWEWDDE
jgi:hypothetical protein